MIPERSVLGALSHALVLVHEGKYDEAIEHIEFANKRLREMIESEKAWIKQEGFK